MPVTAARLADVGARDPQPSVLGGRRQHSLQQLAIAGLQLGALVQPALRRANPLRQRVANRLELTEVEHSRRGRDGGDPGVDLETGKGIRKERAKPMFEAPYLAPQLRPGEPLVAIHAQCGTGFSVQQIRHRPDNECRSSHRPNRNIPVK